MNNDTLTKVLNSLAELQETIFTAVIPAEAHQHFCSSRREALLGVRTILDHTIKRLDEHAIENADEEKPSKHSSRIIEISEA